MKGRDERARVLVVDDGEQYAMSQSGWLREQGYEASCAFSEQEARAYLEEHAREVDVALLDMFMEKPDSGLRLVELVGEKYPWIVTIIVTGHGEFDNAVRCMEAGAFSYIMKDESPLDLILQTLKKGLASKARRIGPFVGEALSLIDDTMQKNHELQALLARISEELSVNLGKRTGRD
jgi:DNA-binding NtrC family response regulator